MARSGGIALPQWTPNKALENMDKANIDYGILSITSPGVYFQDELFARNLARKCNEYISELAAKFPRRWGGFAVLPLPDVKGSLLELDYALDNLHLLGVVLLSNVAGHYLGDPGYEELWQELNRRQAVVFIHPHDPPGSEQISHLIPATEWPFDTARTVASLLHSGFLEKYPDIHFILSHAGGVLPYMAQRIAQPHLQTAKVSRKQKDEIKNLNLLRKLYFDTCQSLNLWTLSALLAFIDPPHILYGTDFGMSFVSRITNFVIRSGLRNYHNLFTQDELDGIYWNNALELFPSLKDEKYGVV